MDALECEIVWPSNFYSLCDREVHQRIGANMQFIVKGEENVIQRVSCVTFEVITYSVLSKSNRYLTMTVLSPLARSIGPAVPPAMSFSASRIRTFRSSP